MPDPTPLTEELLDELSQSISSPQSLAPDALPLPDEAATSYVLDAEDYLILE